MCKNILILLFALVTSSMHAQTGTPIPQGLIRNYKFRCGDKVSIKPTEWIYNVPEDKNLEGKFLVVDFWWPKAEMAYSQGMVAMNRLQKNFCENKNLYFLSFTGFTADAARKMADLSKFETIVINDLNPYGRFWGKGIDHIMLPFCLLIDDQGIIRWIGNAKYLTEKIILEFTAGTLECFNIYSKQITD